MEKAVACFPQKKSFYENNFSGNSFPKSARVLSRSHFVKIEERGKRRAGRFVAIAFIKKERGPMRLGITVTRRYGKAHERNIFKRLVREAFRAMRGQFSLPIDLVIKPRNEAKQASLSDISQDMFTLLSEIK